MHKINAGSGEVASRAASSLAGADSVSVEESTYRAVKLRLIPFLMTCYVLAYLDRVNVGFAKLQMLGDLGFTETVYGVASGAFFVGYILFGVPVNLLLHRVGARLCITLIMVIWGTISGLMAFVATPAQFFVLRLLLGAAEAGFYPGVILYLTCWFPRERQALATSTFQIAVPLAGVFGGPLSGWLLDHMNGYGHLRGWQWLFLIEAVPAAAIGVLAWFYLDDGIARARWLDSAQRDLLMENIARGSPRESRNSVAAAFADLRVWGLGALVFGLAMGVYGISFWMPTLLKGTTALSMTQIGYLSAIPNLLPVFAMVLLAKSSDRTGERRWHVAGASLLGALGLALSVVFSHDLILALASLSLAACGIMSALPLQWTFLAAFARGSGAAAAIALINSVGNLGGILSPALIGWLKDKTASLDAGIYVVAGCATLSAAIALSFPARLVNK